MHTKKTIATADLAEIKRLALAISAEPIQEIEFDDSDFAFDFDTIPLSVPIKRRPHRLTPVGCANGTLKVSIRIPARVLVAFKERAATTGTAYQSLINKTLKDAALGWG